MNDIGITFGSLAEPFRNQLIGELLTAKSCERFQAISDAISRLNIDGIMTKAEVENARNRLYTLMKKAALRKKPAK
jgi:hypothetical protein